ncbi:hypothetical protein GCM10023321_10060 [Pseudonocardia eucalypti]|uniref:DUF4267 domain-containing protein n=1 Tax=Pseudonocardia eucalypti TaxID=648755 RepID=A0ABP9PKP1_9PSEU|nr:hypothetical protein [Pseudonocardia eucalypti]
MRPSALERAPKMVGLVTLVAGAALVAAPGPVGSAMGLGDRRSVARTVGVMDLALVPGLLRGRPRWPWMAARAAFSLATATIYRAEARRSDGRREAVGGMYGMLGLTVADVVVALALRNAERA